MSHREDRTFDFFKHLTTLNFAAMGFLVLAIEQGLVRYPKEEAFPLTFGAFGISLACSFVMMFFTMFPWNIQSEQGKQNALTVAVVVGFGALATFIAGMFLLAVATGLIVLPAKS